jgi:hypothetical protein
MIKKMFFILVLIVSSASFAFSATQLYYLRTTGAGSNYGDTGNWNVVPSSDANAMSAANFNDSRNWSATDNASKLDPDDVVYVKGGTGWNKAAYNLTPVYGITLDFYESGNWTPSLGVKGGRPDATFIGSRIIVNVDNVTVQDGAFTGSSYRVSVGNVNKVRCFKLLRNYIYNDYWVGVRLSFITDSEIAYNYGHSPSGGPTCKWSSMSGGSRNKIHHNIVNGGQTGITFLASLSYRDNYAGKISVPSSGSYALDPEFNFKDNEVYNNHLMSRDEEGITYDVNSSKAGTTVVDRDTIVSVSGNQITLNNSGGEWTGVGNKWSGMYMACNEDDAEKYGKYGLITSQNDNVFTLDTNLSSYLAAGDHITIGFAFINNHIHNNIIGIDGDPGAEGYRPSSILIEGIGLDNVIEENFAYPSNHKTANGEIIPYGVKIQALFNYVNSSYSVTGTSGSECTAGNIVRNNSGTWGLHDYAYKKKLGNGGYYSVYSQNNAFYGNSTLNGYGLKKTLSKSYPGDQYVGSCSNCTLLESDPTDDSWLTKDPLIASPKNVTILVKIP